jgi:2'-5' RNA ligase
MKHRIFIAVNLPEKVKKSLEEIQERNSALPAGWVKRDNLHITLVFLGYVDDGDLLEIFEKASGVASQNSGFSVRLNQVVYGPPKKDPPRMVWVRGEKSKDLGKIQKELEESLSGTRQQESREFSPHITLARIKTWQWKGMEPEERPQVEEEIGLEFEVNSIEVMESYLKRGGPKYEVLESFPLKD